MILYYDKTEYTNKENTKNYGFKYELRNEDNTKSSYSKDSLIVAIRNFKKKYKVNIEPRIITGIFKKEVIDK